MAESGQMALLSGGQGMGGHHCNEAKTHEWLTPPEIIKALGEFDLDPCACTSPRPWDTAVRHYEFSDNGLLYEWDGRVWLNPPYGSHINPWMDRMVKHGNGIALTFARTETRTFFKYVWPHADAILFIEGRLHFHDRNGVRADANSGAPSVLIAYGKNNAEVLHSCSIAGRFVGLK